MTRYIIFRGKQIYNGEWIEGDLLQYLECGKIHIVPHQLGRGGVDVKPETIGQHTGLRDRNGKRIFEGDILSTTNSNCEIWYVDYKLSAFCANQGNANYSCVLEEFMRYSDVKVIGNIHDNPELLKDIDNPASN